MNGNESGADCDAIGLWPAFADGFVFVEAEDASSALVDVIDVAEPSSSFAAAEFGVVELGLGEVVEQELLPLDEAGAVTDLGGLDAPIDLWPDLEEKKE